MPASSRGVVQRQEYRFLGREQSVLSTIDLKFGVSFSAQNLKKWSRERKSRGSKNGQHSPVCADRRRTVIWISDGNSLTGGRGVRRSKGKNRSRSAVSFQTRLFFFSFFPAEKGCFAVEVRSDDSHKGIRQTTATTVCMFESFVVYLPTGHNNNICQRNSPLCFHKKKRTVEEWPKNVAFSSRTSCGQETWGRDYSLCCVRAFLLPVTHSLLFLFHSVLPDTRDDHKVLACVPCVLLGMIQVKASEGTRGTGRDEGERKRGMDWSAL